MSLANLHFSAPWFLLLLCLVPVFAIWKVRRVKQVTLRYSDLQLVKASRVSGRLRMRWVPDGMRLLGLVLLILAMARPQASRDSEIVRGKGVDIILALDISGSMAALDFKPENRMTAAKQVISDFILERKYDRIGIVVFAREAFSQSPPTFDYQVLRQLLSTVALAPDLGLEDGTAVGMGVAQAAVMLKDSDAKSRVIILLTDGVNNAGLIDPLTAAQAAAAMHIKVYTIGMGKPGQVEFPVDTIFGRRTQLIESEIDEDALREIADITHALYFRATDTEGLRQIYAEINEMEKSEVEVQLYTRYKELSGWLVIPAIGLLVVEIVLRNTIYRSIP